MFCLALAFIQLEPNETTLLQCQADHHAEVYLCYVKQCWSSTQTLILENNLSQKTLNDVNFGTINFLAGRKTSALWHFFVQKTASCAKVSVIARETLGHMFCLGLKVLFVFLVFLGSTFHYYSERYCFASFVQHCVGVLRKKIYVVLHPHLSLYVVY